MPPEAPTKRCLFALTDAALIVANTGATFNRLGVISICNAYLSTKGEAPPIDNYDRDGPLIAAIQMSALHTYKAQGGINLLTEHASAEIELQREYGGRSLWELLQNADDANAPAGSGSSQLIGAKGLGFKSVLEITNEPEIHSGDFHFLFSAEKTRELLQREISAFSGTLTFRIPHPVEPTLEIRSLLAEFQTVIRLPFRDTVARDKASRWMEQWRTSTRIPPLLLCQHITELRLGFKGTPFRWRSLQRPEPFADGDIVIEAEHDGKLPPTAFRRWAHSWKAEGAVRQHSVAVTMPLTPGGEPEAFDETIPLHVFFPTDERLSLHALIHASFELKTSREHVRDSDYDQSVMDELGAVVERLIQSVPARVTLRALVPHEPSSDGVACRIQERIVQVLTSVAFIPCIGGGRQTVKLARHYEPYLGSALDTSAPDLAHENLVEPDLIADAPCRTALKKLGATALPDTDYPRLLRLCRNRSLAECQHSFETLARMVKESTPKPHHTDAWRVFCDACRAVPCWWTVSDVPRPLAGGPPLLRSPIDGELPPWIVVDVIDPEMAKALRAVEEKWQLEPSNRDAWKKISAENPIQVSTETLLARVLVFALRDKTSEEWWQAHGWEALHLFAAWCPTIRNFADIEPIAITTGGATTDHRDQVASVLHLPTNRGWLPALQCYAGHAWGGPASFDQFFPAMPDRGIVSPPEDWPPALDPSPQKWKWMLRWVGVSWEPKLLHYSASVGTPFFDRPTNPFPTRNWPLWELYGAGLKPAFFCQQSHFQRSPQFDKQWAIEFFPECLGEKIDGSVLMLMRPLVQFVSNHAKRMSYSYAARQSARYFDTIDSFAKFQIHEASWLPAKQSVLFPNRTSAAKTTYMPGKSLCGLLPEIGVTISDDQAGRDLASFLVQDLHIHDGPPSADSPLWREWLELLAEKLGDPEVARNHEIAIRALYRHVLAFKERPTWLPSPLAKIACEKRSAEQNRAEIRFLRPRDVFYLDEPHLEAARAELVRHFPVFLLRLDEWLRAVGWFGLRAKLSEVVTIRPTWDVRDAESLIVSIYDRRKPAVEAMVGKNLPSPNQLCVVRPLQISITRGQNEIATVPVASWNNDGEILVDADNPSRGLAIALARLVVQPKLADAIENILRADDDTEVVARLRHYGIPEEAINEIVVPPLPPTGDPITGPQQDGPSDPGTTTPAKPERGASIENRPGFHRRRKGNTGQNYGSNSTPIADSSEVGLHAESWLRNEIKSRFGDLCGVSDAPVRDEHGRETDILVTAVGRQVHIEAKRLKGRTIFWSDLEASKATDHPGNYYMALLRPVGSDDYSVHWLWNPLSELLSQQRRGVWLWPESRRDVPIEDESWSPPEPKPERQAGGFSFRIDVSDDFVLGKPEGLEELRTRLQQ